MKDESIVKLVTWAYEQGWKDAAYTLTETAKAIEKKELAKHVTDEVKKALELDK